MGARLSHPVEAPLLAPRTLDELLELGTRPARGQLIEITGDVSSGRTALAYRLAAGTTARGELVAWVDLPNALDPLFLRRAGVDLEAVLWVRPPGVAAALRAAELLVRTGFATVAIDLEGTSPRDLAKLGPAVWTRLLRAVRESRATAALLAPQPLAGSFATLALHTERRGARFERGLFEGLDAHAAVLRDRSGVSGGSAASGAGYALHVSHRPR